MGVFQSSGQRWGELNKEKGSGIDRGRVREEEI